MHKVILIAMICVATVMAQTITTTAQVQPIELKHGLYSATYNTSLTSTSNTAILLSCGAVGMSYGLSIDFLAATLNLTDVDIRIYPVSTWTNGTTPTQNPVWQPAYTTGAQVTGIQDMVDLNLDRTFTGSQPIGSWLKKMSDSTYANYWAGMTNIGANWINFYAQATSARPTYYLPFPITMAPNSRHVIILSNRTAAASNAAMLVNVYGYIQR